MTRRVGFDRYVPGQNVFLLSEPLSISGPDFDLSQAEQAAEYRKKRHGVLALDRRTAGFNRRVRGLWVPHSGTENTAVVELPEPYIRFNQELVRDKVLEKYDGSDINPTRVLLWAYFASNKRGRDLRQKFNSFIIDAQEGYRRINVGLESDGEIIREKIEASQVAYQGVQRYITFLQAFVGAEGAVGPGGKRKWPHPAHKNVVAERLEWADHYLSGLNDEEFNQTVFEAYLSERSREVFWTGVHEDYIEYLKSPTRAWIEEPVPLEVLLGDPRAQDDNYVDGEYIF